VGADDAGVDEPEVIAERRSGTVLDWSEKWLHD
jgi:hypothetical protein